MRKQPVNSQFKWTVILLAFNAILFASVLFCLKPLLNSGDDAFVMYTFGGGFGLPPSELVEYDWLWHIFISIPIVNLFEVFPSINWYTAFLLAVHFISLSAILLVFSIRFEIKTSIFYYIIFFLFFETPFLLSLSFSNTSIIAAFAGNLLFLYSAWDKKKSILPISISIMFFLLSGLLRFHTWALVEVLFFPLFIYYHNKSLFRYFSFKIAAALTLILFFSIHMNYYKKQIPGWQQEENKKKFFYASFNSALDSGKLSSVIPDEIQREFFLRNFNYDSSYNSTDFLQEKIPLLTRNRSLFNEPDREKLYWHFMEARVYLFLIAMFLLVMVLGKNFSLIVPFALVFAWIFVIYSILFIYFKVPDYMFFSFLAFLWFSIPAMKNVENDLFRKAGSNRFLPLLIIFFPVAWMCIRIIKINQKNIEKYNSWICAYHDIKQHPSTIHFASDNDFPIDYFSVTESPGSFAMNNFVSRSQFPSIVYRKKIKALGTEDVLEELVTNKSFIFVGKQLHTLPLYYKEKRNKEIEIEPVPGSYKCLNAYRINESSD